MYTTYYHLTQDIPQKIDSSKTSNFPARFMTTLLLDRWYFRKPTIFL